MTETKVLLTTEEATSWLLDSIALYHITPFQSKEDYVLKLTGKQS
jgi:hypothetical protein